MADNLTKPSSPQTVIGWREWLSLPDIGIPAVKAKVDTGARTSALHAFSLEPFEKDGEKKIRFRIHPLQRRHDVVLECEADVIDRRVVSDSGGHRELRYFIRTRVIIGNGEIDAEISLTDRDTMRFRMLLGRTALKERFLVDSGRSYLAGSRPDGIYGMKRKRWKK